MEEINGIIIPSGWTYFAHRTNTDKWLNNPFELSVINLDRLMCVVTEDDVHTELRHYGSNHSQAYNFGQGIPFEIRCLICDLKYLRKMSDDVDEKNIMLKEFYYDRMNFGGLAGHRHHSIPKGEKLITIGIGKFDEVFKREKKIIWTIPLRFIELYKKDIMKNECRIISLEKTDIKNIEWSSEAMAFFHEIGINPLELEKDKSLNIKKQSMLENNPQTYLYTYEDLVKLEKDETTFSSKIR